MSRIFLSHSSRNDAEALALRDWLVAEGWDDLFLDLDPKRGIVAGERWERALSQAAKRCEAVIFLVSEAWLASRWCQREFDLAMKLNKRVFGVLIEDVKLAKLPREMTRAWQTTNLVAGKDHRMFRVVHDATGEERHVTFSKAGLAKFKEGLTRAGLDQRFFAWPPEDDKDRPPYRGLLPLEAEDAGIFFGREAQTIEGLDRLRGLASGPAPRLMVILGASGAGKSSFLRAGLLSRLSRDDRDFLPLPPVRAERAALTGETGFARSLDGAATAVGLKRTRAEIGKALKSGPEHVAALLNEIAAKAGDPALVLPIDQGEELFLAEGAAEADAFLAMLNPLLRAETPKLLALMAIRSDAFERLQIAPELEGIEPQTMSLPPLARGAYRDVIEGPARRLAETDCPLVIDPALTQALLSDIEEGGAKDALPLLAFTLERLYLDHGSDGDIKVAEYIESGRIKGAIEAAVARALARADSDPAVPKDHDARIALLRRAFIPWLAGVDPETNAPRRRVARLSEIPADSQPLVHHLIDQRLLAMDREESTGATIVEPAHEALLRQWGLLQSWLDEDTAALSALDGVKRDARDWEANARNEAWLSHTAGRLEDAERFSVREELRGYLTDSDQAYLAQCRAADTARRHKELIEARKLAEAQATVARRTKIGLMAAACLVLLALGAALFAFQQKNVAERLAAKAVINETTTLASLSHELLQRGLLTESVKVALAAWPRRGDATRPKLRSDVVAVSAALEKLHERLRIEGHGDWVNSVAFSPDGKNILTGSKDKTAQIWNANTGKRLKTLHGHSGEIIVAAYSPDGRRVVTGSDDRTARIWDVGIPAEGEHSASGDGTTLRTGTLVTILNGHTKEIWAASYSPDGKRIVTGSFDKTARIWDAETGAELKNLKGHDGRVYTAAYSPDGKRVVTGSDDNTVRIWDPVTGTQLRTLEGHDGVVYAAAYSRDGRRIVTASYDETARIWDADNGALLNTLKGHTKAVWAAAFSPDDKHIVTASFDDTARIWSAETGTLLKILEGHTKGVWAVAYSPDGARVVTGSLDNTARLWDATTGALPMTLGHSVSVSAAAYSPDGARIVTGSSDNIARVWDAASGSLLKSLEGHSGPVSAVAFSPDGTRILTGSSDKTARIWDAATGNVLEVLEGDRHETPARNGHTEAVRAVAFSPDGSRLATGSWDNTARVWDVATGSALKTLEYRTDNDRMDDVSGVAFSPDGRRIATGSSDGVARIWDASTGVLLQILASDTYPVFAIVFSPDGARIMTGSGDKTARVWDAATGNLLATLKGHEGAIWAVGFSRDSTRIVTGSVDGTARIWDAATGAVLRTLAGHDAWVTAIALSPDGTHILTGSRDKTARIWDISDLEKGDAFQIACLRLGKNIDLKDIEQRYRVEPLPPICGDHPPAPVDLRELQ